MIEIIKQYYNIFDIFSIFFFFSLLSESELKEVTSELITRMEKHVAEGVAVDDALINHHLTDPYIFSKCVKKDPQFMRNLFLEFQT